MGMCCDGTVTENDTDPVELRSVAEQLAEAAAFVRRRRDEVFGDRPAPPAPAAVRAKSTPTDPVTVVDTDFDRFDAQYDLGRITAKAVAAGAVTVEQGAEWLDSIRRRASAGSFFASMTNFVISGRKA